ncbi:MAG TPA: ATPase domain-containing protein [Candidatus Binataceae bacterium]
MTRLTVNVCQLDDAAEISASPAIVKVSQLPEISGVFRGHELTRKDRDDRLSSGLSTLDTILSGGIARGRISEIIGRAGSGRTSLAASFAAAATRRGEVAAWIESSGAFDPASIAASGVDLARVLWASISTRSGVPPSCKSFELSSRQFESRALQSSSRDQFQPSPIVRKQSALLKAVELVLEAGGFGLVVVDFGDAARSISSSAALRLARAAERCGAVVLMIAPHRMCGTFAVLSLVLRRVEASFGRLAPGAPSLFDGLTIDATVARNKLGGRGASALVYAMTDPAAQFILPQSHRRNDLRKIHGLQS